MSATPALGKRARTKEANRAAILAAAREVFAELGFGAASVRDVVRRTDLATGTFYNYFPDKESVFRALLAEDGELARRRVQAARAEATSAEDFVHGGFRAYFEHLAADRVLFEVVRRNAGTIRAFADEGTILLGTAELAADLSGAVARGLLPAHDTQRMAAAMVGAGVELGVRMAEDDPPDVAGTARFAADLFLAALAPRA